MAGRRHLWNRERTLTGVCAFLLPCALMLTVFAVVGVYPFGQKTLLILDMNSEYIDYYAQLHRALRTGGSLLRSWNMGMGLNMLGLIAFYTASPLNLIILLFPIEWITEAVLLVTLIKIGLAGLLFACYASEMTGRSGVFAVGFAVAYALCGYNIAYASNLMWLDGVAFLPLVLLGVERLLRERKCGLLLFSLVYIFLTSYYIAYMIGVFAFFYLTAACLVRTLPWREYWRHVVRLIAVAAVAAGCCAVLLLPAYLNLRSGQNEMWALHPSLVLERPWLRILSRLLLPGAYDTPTDAGYPNIYCSVPAALFCTLFFLHRGIPRREKVVYGGLLGLLLLSFSCEMLDLAWHAFEDPTWYPARYSFLFSFVVLMLAMRAAKELRSIVPAAVVGAASLLLVLVAEAGAARYRHVSRWPIVAAVALILIWSGLWWLLRRSKNRRGQSALALVALVLLCAETWGNALANERGLDKQFHYRDRSELLHFREQYGKAVEALDEAEEPYRLEIVQQRSANGSMMLGYYGISHYSTTTDQTLNAFLCGLGYNRGTENELRFTRNTPLANGLLGIRYVLSKGDLGEGYRKIHEVGEVGIYENLCAFPIAFWGIGQLPEERIEDNPFELQNHWLRQMGFEQMPYQPVAEVRRQLDNLTQVENDTHITFRKYAPKQEARAKYWIGNPQHREIYAYFPVWNRKFSAGKVYVNGEFLQNDLRYRNNAVAPLGNSSPLLLELAIDKETAELQDEILYSLDMDAAMEVAQRAGEHAVQWIQFQDTALTGIVQAPEEGMVFTTIPSDSGWRVWLDGERVQPVVLQGVFTALPVPAGEHVIEMRYLPPGFQLGCAVSAGVICAVLGLGVKKTLRKARENH